MTAKKKVIYLEEGEEYADQIIEESGYYLIYSFMGSIQLSFIESSLDTCQICGNLILSGYPTKKHANGLPIHALVNDCNTVERIYNND